MFDRSKQEESHKIEMTQMIPVGHFTTNELFCRRKDGYHYRHTTNNILTFIFDNFPDLLPNTEKTNIQFCELLKNSYDSYADFGLNTGAYLIIKTVILWDNNNIEIKIKDNGKGFSLNNDTHANIFNRNDISYDKKGMENGYVGGNKKGLIYFEKYLKPQNGQLKLKNRIKTHGASVHILFQAPDTHKRKIETIQPNEKHRNKKRQKVSILTHSDEDVINAECRDEPVKKYLMIDLSADLDLDLDTPFLATIAPQQTTQSSAQSLFNYHYQLAMHQKNIESMLFLANAYLLGNGVVKDSTTALHYFQLAAESGHMYIQVLLGQCYLDGKSYFPEMNFKQDIRLAMYYFELAANRGDQRSQTLLAECYSTGAGVEKNLRRAIFYFTLVANAGDVSSQFRLAQLYTELSNQFHDANITNVEYQKLEKLRIEYSQKAAYYFSLAANQGHVESQTMLAAINANKAVDISINCTAPVDTSIQQPMSVSKSSVSFFGGRSPNNPMQDVAEQDNTEQLIDLLLQDYPSAMSNTMRES